MYSDHDRDDQGRDEGDDDGVDDARQTKSLGTIWIFYKSVKKV